MERSLIGEYATKHRESRYGTTGIKVLPHVAPHAIALAPRSLIDYGCGQSRLGPALGAVLGVDDVARYDPAIPALSALPVRRFDLLISIDVLEHIPDGEIDAVAREMAGLAAHAYLVIDTAPAKARLSDGSNAHVSLHDGPWWLQRLRPSFPTLRQIPIGRRNRVAFKTFDAELPPLRAAAVRGWFQAVVRARRVAAKVGLHPVD
ncbi:hypothetical protein [Mongoliimonas terrestris]|uniref:hypothetical protein n=1 Tax=Mongoliimonas terrestris TaxID=1709001 RepID=UPI00094990A6|nr:hypothetical protein [Mongoliimonas terrestris]